MDTSIIRCTCNTNSAIGFLLNHTYVASSGSLLHYHGGEMFSPGMAKIHLLFCFKNTQDVPVKCAYMSEGDIERERFSDIHMYVHEGALLGVPPRH